MPTPKIVAGVAGSIVVLAIGALIYMAREIGEARKAVAASVHRLGDLRARQLTLEGRIAESTRRAQELEADNERLRKTTQTAQATQPATAMSGTVESRFKRAQELLRTTYLDAALKELLWCYDEGMAGDPRYANLRDTTVLMLIAQIAKKYPPAAAALRERLDRVEQRIFENPGDLTGVFAIASRNATMGESARNVALFDKLPAGDPRRQVLFAQIFDQLVAAKRYSDVVASRSFASMTRQFEETMQLSARLEPGAPSSDRFRRAQRDFVLQSAAQNIEALAGTGDLDHARTLAEKLLAYDASDQTKALLQKHLERAGQPGLLTTPSK